MNALAGETDHPAAAPEPHPLRGLGAHFYSAKAAMRVELAAARTATAGKYAIDIELTNGHSGQSYDWSNKIRLQISGRELPVVGAFLLGYAGDTLELRHHGQDRNKHLLLRRQPGKVFVSVQQATRIVGIPLAAHSVFELTTLVLDTLQRNRPATAPAFLLAALQACGAFAGQSLHAAGRPRAVDGA